MTSAPHEKPFRLEIDTIQRFLPHRPPFLLVDRILEIDPQGDLKNFKEAKRVGTRVVAQKNVSMNEPYFQGHFPSYPIMPGVLIIEAMAQAACFSFYPWIAHDLDRLAKEFKCILLGVDSTRFRKPVVPGDVLKIETVVTKTRGTFWSFQCVVEVDQQKVAEAELLANLIHGF